MISAGCSNTTPNPPEIVLSTITQSPNLTTITPTVPDILATPTMPHQIIQSCITNDITNKTADNLSGIAVYNQLSPDLVTDLYFQNFETGTTRVAIDPNT